MVNKFCCVLSAIIMACGLVGGGYFAVKKVTSNREMIEVKGLSERIVRSDCCEIEIHIKNYDTNIEKMYAKHKNDKEIVMEQLRTWGVKDSEISGYSCDVQNRTEYDSSAKETKFAIDEGIYITTQDLNKAKDIKLKLPDLMLKDVFVTCSYKYKISDFNKIKTEMLKEAAQNARECAEAFIGALDRRLGDVVYLNQGAIIIKAPNESDESSWSSSESQSVEKKLRLVVRAGFKKAD